MNFIQFDSVYQEILTGEMFVPASDQSGRLVPTGFYFMRVTQQLPLVEDMQGPRVNRVVLTPWAFATSQTALQICNSLQPLLKDKLTLEPADANSQFPYSAKQWQIAAVRGNRKARVNAGLIASNIARTTAVVDGKVKQFPDMALRLAADELVTELEYVQD